MNNKYYIKYSYLMFGDPEKRNGFIVCKFYDVLVGQQLLNKLNNDK